MAIDDDEELLQDFLVEAGEILDQLNEQLVDLEQRPNDSDLLNSVFRGFHTIKGGAGFLSLNALVDLCHRAEDVFNALRNGERSVDAQLMDVILPVVDVLNSQFDQIRSGSEPEKADPKLLRQLEELLHPGVSGKVDANATDKEINTETCRVSGKSASAQAAFRALPDHCHRTDCSDAGGNRLYLFRASLGSGEPAVGPRCRQ